MSKQNTTAATLYDSLSDYSLEVSEKNTPANIDRLLMSSNYHMYPKTLNGPDGPFEGILFVHKGNWSNPQAKGETHYAISTPDGGWDAETSSRIWANDPRNNS